MPLLSRYSFLKKADGRNGRMVTFGPTRAMGLAVEEGWRRAMNIVQGFSDISSSDLCNVNVTGDLEIFVDGSWQSSRRCGLTLQSGHADLSLQVLHAQRQHFQDAKFNVCKALENVGRSLPTLDLVGDFAPSAARRLQVFGHVWVELKLFDADCFGKKVAAEEKKLEARLPQVQSRGSSIKAVMLVSAKVEKTGRSSWQLVGIQSKLLAGSSEQWVDIAGGIKHVARGFVASKPDLVQLWKQLDWFKPFSPRRSPLVAKLSQVFKVLKLPSGNVGKRAVNLNKKLPPQKKLKKMKVATAGSKPWVGKKSTLRCVHALL